MRLGQIIGTVLGIASFTKQTTRPVRENPDDVGYHIGPDPKVIGQRMAHPNCQIPASLVQFRHVDEVVTDDDLNQWPDFVPDNIMDLPYGS